MNEIVMNGDLNQISTQKRFLLAIGFDIDDTDGFPHLKIKNNCYNALKAIYDNEINGFWNYEEELIFFGIIKSKDEILNKIRGVSHG